MSCSLSAVIITKNEEKNIGKCLEALSKVSDEIIVIDSLSTDKTEEICLSYKAQFIKRPFAGYSATKNHGNSLAKGDFIISIDADEILSEELISNILEEKSKGFPQTIYRFNRLTNYCGTWIKHCGWYPDTKTRLWKNGIANWEGSIHETLSYPKELSPTHLSGDILHFSFHSIEQHLNVMNKYTTLMAEEAFNKGKKASMFKLIFSPLFKFIKKYFFQKGFLDGYYGFIVCVLSAFYAFFKFIKLRRLQQINNNQ
ncbi:glycosyltransferase family 2 protein [Aureibacter tunicatorum]|uniref:Glycosyltransferase involved in cell wall biosynthesis n=1 Tax=Aureibacter tunicatorum TaxID=866807 RepID=A0AAE4BS11_9BACT|nr:glycosyltransferase family 2 protein [Aureibacter tunicatorum]MDR6237852.1 glycosyltransferase involved in cell wall biosynthesis [Aureibacter tunicatorum]BDD02887.1 glycosyl transferase [Aureibacter tunicatorum]